ncbi:dTDP-4-dehydrorhamnose reductase [Sphingobium rhizovicinum]|uniref:dTDP-4-dehydrorhamnose reductase n=1 Tax=Sphingobium rhizovicinum TaxID=432308 RepID=A0ABV7ND66_9SPHN
MKALITGCNGQLGRSLQATVPDGVTLVCVGSAELDLSQPDLIKPFVESVAPDIIINAAAYTAVDKAETDSDRAMAVNGTAVGALADAARSIGARFVHVSTDFVFDGGAGTPYAPDAPTSPLGVYGSTKLAGEQLAGTDSLIVRTAWVYAPVGGNFVHTMLRLMKERPEIRVVADQIGTPSYAPALASAIWKLVDVGATGIYHYTDSGAASWYDFAVAIYEEGRAAGLLDKDVTILPIATADYPTPARRPSYSVLDKGKTFAALGGPAPHWRTQLRQMIAGMQAASQ